MSQYDEFDNSPRGAGLLSNIGAKAAFFIVLIALSFMIGVVWKLYVGGGSGAGQNVPIVRAETTPYKVTPDDPGGMDIPYKDSTIFSSADRGDGNRIENLLADEDQEEPMPRSQLFAGLNTAEVADSDMPSIDNTGDDIPAVSAEAQDVVDTIIEESTESVMPSLPAPTPETPVEEIKEGEQESAAPVAPVIQPPPQPKPKAVPKPQPAPAAVIETGDYFVQLGSVKSREGAENEWKKFQAKYSSILSGYSYRIESADLGAKGLFYRIQAGPVSKSAAIQACTDIKKTDPNGCLLKKK